VFSRNVDTHRPAASKDHPERQLWCAVIGRALNDALDAVSAASGASDRMRIREEARTWFMRNGQEFRAACESAGYDPDYLRSRFLKLMEGHAPSSR
jgi:hypothetical protein